MSYCYVCDEEILPQEDEWRPRNHYSNVTFYKAHRDCVDNVLHRFVPAY